jgi:methionyl-tRNA formyltransferase
LRGAAPIHYALLNRRNHTGVSVQTLHPTKFDHGQIIAQTALPGIPIPAGSTPASLLPVLAEEGATLLKKVIESGAYLPPTQTSRLSEEDILRVTNGEGIVKAPRFRKSDMRIDWDQMTAADIALRRLVFGRLWDDRIYHALSDAEQPTRIMFDDLKDVSKEFESIRAITGELETGLPWAIGSNSGELRLLIPTAGNSMIEVVSCTIASKKTGLGKPELLRILTK